MRAATLESLLEELGVLGSCSLTRVSNENPLLGIAVQDGVDGVWYRCRRPLQVIFCQVEPDEIDRGLQRD